MRTKSTTVLVASLAFMIAACDSDSKGEAKKPAAAPPAANGAPVPVAKVIPALPGTIQGEAQKPAAAPPAANGAPAPAPKVIPPFPWTILGEVYPDRAAFDAALAANKWSGHAVAINGVLVVIGFGPAANGTSGTPAPASQRP